MAMYTDIQLVLLRAAAELPHVQKVVAEEPAPLAGVVLVTFAGDLERHSKPITVWLERERRRGV